ncbi:hypothetical protein H4K36_01115 [Streptomyces sp. DHE7-1]|uniref:hypothetical protein n=1 Tax=Streptomycetaceae TaxID=2062 RepID=UPI0018EE4D1A|nr:hypothetical protein [Streptomyces sp. DHE7-1]MBJ6636910.1 hypothetical protein [Streptomyces sp. DHE7-1]
MTTHDVLFLMLTVLVLVLASVLVSIIGFGLARWTGAAVPDAVSRAALAFAGTLTIGVALLGVLITAVK